MEARRYRAALVLAATGLVCSSDLFAASDRTANFIVSAPSRELAREVAQMAEQYRRDLAVEWIGQELPRWHEPCPITVRVGPHLGAGGATSFMFDHGQPFGWRMSIQGSRQRLLDSVLPHEVTHTIFATYFGRPLPRWADEGACTSVEHVSEKSKQVHMLNQFLRSKPSRGIPFNRMYAMKEYPSDIMPLYSQGFSLVRFLLNQGGKQKFMQYVADGMRNENWNQATEQHYGFRDLSELQLSWVDWVAEGSPDQPDRSQIASAAPQLPRAVQQQTRPDAFVAQGPRSGDPYGRGRRFERFDDRIAKNEAPLTQPHGQQDLVPVRDTPDADQPVMMLADRDRSEVITRGQNAPSEGSWYARQRDKVRNGSMFSIGGSAGGSRIAFSSFASLAAMGKSLSRPPRQLVETVRPVFDLEDPVPPPPAAQQEANELLNRPLVPARKPIYFDRLEKPLSAGGTVWR